LEAYLQIVKFVQLNEKETKYCNPLFFHPYEKFPKLECKFMSLEMYEVST
jgi:hypothetical protein